MSEIISLNSLDVKVHNQQRDIIRLEKAFVALLSKNKYELQEYINYFDGKIVDGVKITESGILAAAHLGGTGSVKRFLNSNGEKKCKDDYGTSVKTYLKDFGGYETKGIKAIKNAQVN